MANEIKIARTTTDEDALREFAAALSPSIRVAVAENPHTPEDVLLQLARSNELDVRLAASRRLDPEVLVELNASRESLAPLAAPPRTRSLYMTTTEATPGATVTKVLGIVFGSSSKLAWGFNKQADRLDQAMNAALFDLEDNAIAVNANAVIGLTFAANSSSGSASTVLGSSDAILVMGTAVEIES